MNDGSFFRSKDDNDLIEQIYLEYKQRMYSVAVGILHNKMDAEDAVYQSFLRIVENIDKIKALSCQEIPPYIVIIVRNASIQIYNENKKNLEMCTEIDDNVTNLLSESVDDIFFEKIESQRLKDAIMELSDMYKDVLYLTYVCDMKAKEIAPIMNISVDNVWKRLERAKRLIKESLERNESNE